jgi:hypothetical protein
LPTRTGTPIWPSGLAQRASDKPFTLAEALCSGLGFQDPVLITRDEQRRAAACLRMLGHHRRYSERRGNRLAHLPEWLWHPVELRQTMEHQMPQPFRTIYGARLVTATAPIDRFSRR